jgi:hypothetical protein
MSKFGFYKSDADNDRNLIEQLLIENNEFNGVDCHFLPKSDVNLDKLFGEASEERFSEAFIMPLILENPDGFSGGGENMFSKFGMNLDFTDSLSIGMLHFKNITGIDAPLIGDVIYIEMMNKFFSISYVNPRTMFYNSGQLYVYKMDVTALKYDGENFDTGNDEVDNAAPTTNSPFIEDDNDIIDDAAEKDDLFQDWDEVENINDTDDDDE